MLWDIVKDNKDRPEIQIKAVHELHALTINLINGFQNLPGDHHVAGSFSL
ncbi:MAG: hypothetical protein ACJ72F_10435 [Nitrososphaeraceae archaeon]